MKDFNNTPTRPSISPRPNIAADQPEKCHMSLLNFLVTCELSDLKTEKAELAWAHSSYKDDVSKYLSTLLYLAYVDKECTPLVVYHRHTPMYSAVGYIDYENRIIVPIFDSYLTPQFSYYNVQNILRVKPEYIHMPEEIIIEAFKRFILIAGPISRRILAGTQPFVYEVNCRDGVYNLGTDTMTKPGDTKKLFEYIAPITMEEAKAVKEKWIDKQYDPISSAKSCISLLNELYHSAWCSEYQYDAECMYTTLTTMIGPRDLITFKPEEIVNELIDVLTTEYGDDSEDDDDDED